MAKKGRKKGQKPPPKCKAILLCDQVIIDRLTGKTSVIGIFEKFVLPRFPGFTRPVNAFVQLTDGIGKCNLMVEVHDLQKNEVIGRAQGFGVEFIDRLTKISVIIPVPSLPMAHPGTYDFVVSADGQEIDRQKFAAAETPQQAQEHNGGDDED